MSDPSTWPHSLDDLFPVSPRMSPPRLALSLPVCVPRTAQDPPATPSAPDLHPQSGGAHQPPHPLPGAQAGPESGVKSQMLRARPR